MGGFGADLLSGGDAKDRFLYKSINEFGDTILDFESKKDVIDLKKIEEITTHSDLTTTQNGDDTLVHVQVDNRLQTVATLRNVDAETLSVQNFAL